MNIKIFGTGGYVGLVTAACLANDHHVIGMDINGEKIDQLNQGKVPFFEPGLIEIVNKNLMNKSLEFTTKSSLENVSVCFITVDTPCSEDGSANLSSIRKVAATIAEELLAPCLVVIKSTVPTGTCEDIEGQINQKLEELQKPFSIEVVSNPEFLREGSAIDDFENPDRIIVGINSPNAQRIMSKVYARTADRLEFMDRASAETVKYASNAALALRISYINEIALFCERVGADIKQVEKGIGRDHRIGNKFLSAGIGYGGSCFPKDTSAFGHLFKIHGIHAYVLDAIQKRNDTQKEKIGQMLFTYFHSKLEGKTIGILGLAFKPNTDDMREAPSITLINYLLSQKVKLQLLDPQAVENAKKIFGENDNISWHTSSENFGHGLDAIVLTTEWEDFKNMDLNRLAGRMQGKAFFDGRNFLAPSDVQNAGFEYYGIGRYPVKAIPLS